MKLLSVALLAIVAVVASQQCKPNSTFRSYCNTCTCASNGEYAVCTQMGCDYSRWNPDGTRKDVPSEQPRHKKSTEGCVPHTTFKDYCNTCTCGADGKTMACTLMYCDPAIWNKDGTLKPKTEEPQQYCEPHTTFKDYCNTCICSRDGKTAACTLMACDPRVWNKDGTLKSNLKRVDEEVSKSQESQEQICEPRSTFKDYCNTCKCSDDGKDSVCTLMACDLAVWNKDGTRKSQIKVESDSDESDLMCEPGSTFKDYCNTCKCSNDGKDAFCTLMACDPAVWNKDGTRKSQIKEESESDESDLMCEPNTTFKDYCNTCKCSNDGKNAACTLMACDERVWNKDGTKKISLRSVQAEESKEISGEAQKCEPGKAYSPDGCNTCVCNMYGTASACTLKLCISNLIRTHSDKETKKWGPLYNQGDNCKPKESFYSECNVCICNRDGKGAFCTLMLC